MESTIIYTWFKLQSVFENATASQDTAHQQCCPCVLLRLLRLLYLTLVQILLLRLLLLLWFSHCWYLESRLRVLDCCWLWLWLLLFLDLLPVRFTRPRLLVWLTGLDSLWDECCWLILVLLSLMLLLLLFLVRPLKDEIFWFGSRLEIWEFCNAEFRLKFWSWDDSEPTTELFKCILLGTNGLGISE